MSIAERIGSVVDVATNLCFLGWTLFDSGRIDEARQELERAVLMVRPAEPSWLTVAVPMHAGWIHLEAGEWGRAAQYLEEGLRGAERLGDNDRLLWGYGGLAWVQVFQGATYGALAYETVVPGLDCTRPGAAWLLAPLALAHLQEGNLAQAERRAAQAAAMCTDADLDTRIQVRRVQALMAAQRGRNEDAMRTLGELLSTAREMFRLWEAATVLETTATVQKLAGNLQAAESSVREALATYQRLGAEGHEKRVTDLLREILAAAPQAGSV